VVVGLPGYLITSQVATASLGGTLANYSNAWLILQVPYGVLGVSLLTALMPRMSSAAAEGRTGDLISDLSLGSRLSAVFLVPISVLFTVFGTAVGVALFGLRASNLSGATQLGATIAVSAFGLLPYALTMLQARVFFALTDSRTPTWILLISTTVRIALVLACPSVLAPQDVVLGLAVANSLSFVVGAVVGEVVLQRKIGRLQTGAVLATTGRTLAASIAGMLAAWVLTLALAGPLSGLPRLGAAWVQLVLATIVGGGLTLVAMRLLRVAELDPLIGRIERIVGRGKARR
jgi:putative peptidoglycan lipid II flippase